MSSIAITHPEIAAQWHPSRNGDLKPTDVTFGSNKKVWWLCPSKCTQGCLHEYQATPNKRSSGRGCPYCASPPKKICIHDSLRYNFPDIADQLHPEYNDNVNAIDIMTHSHKVYWWLCPNTCKMGCKHEWRVSVDKRVSGTGCPYCVHNPKLLCEHMSIKYTHPEISEQWHPILNGDKLPSQFSSGSHEYVWWLCPSKCPNGCSHEWQTRIHKRCISERNCPFCVNQRVLCEHVSIAFSHPSISSMWHTTKNIEITPSMFISGSRKKVWWICNKNNTHEWEASIYRVINGSGCPHCKHKTETKLLDYLKCKFPDVQSQFRPDWCKNPKTGCILPFDFFIPSIDLIVELDGPQHFRQISNWDCYKNTIRKDAFKMNCAFGRGLSVMRLVQEEILDATNQWLDEHLLPNLVKSEEPSFIIATAQENIYDELEKLLDEDIVLSAEDNEED